MSVKKNNYLEISALLHSDIITNLVLFFNSFDFVCCCLVIEVCREASNAITHSSKTVACKGNQTTRMTNSVHFLCTLLQTRLPAVATVIVGIVQQGTCACLVPCQSQAVINPCKARIPWLFPCQIKNVWNLEIS